MGVSGQRPGPLYPVKDIWYALYRRLGGLQSRSGRVRKISALPGFDPSTVQPVANSYVTTPVDIRWCKTAHVWNVYQQYWVLSKSGYSQAEWMCCNIENDVTPRVTLTHGYSRLLHHYHLRAHILTVEVQHSDTPVTSFMTFWILVHFLDNFIDFHVLLLLCIILI